MIITPPPPVVIDLTVDGTNIDISTSVVNLDITTEVADIVVDTTEVDLTIGDGIVGPAGNGITSVELSGVDLLVNYTDLPQQNVGRVVGQDGRGITSVTQPSGPSTAQVNYTSGSPDTINLPAGPAGPAGANGDRYATISTTSFSIPNNNQQRTFTIGTGLAYTNEQTIIVATTDGSGHHWHGVVDSYNAGTGVIIATCTNRTGTGTYASWQVNLSGAVGTAGDNGWSPVLAVVTDGSRRVFQVTDWVGGTGTKPATGQYVGATGLVSDIALAVDVRGATGATGTTGATGNGIASITQPDGTATMLVTYTNASTQTVNLPNAMINPNIAEWNDNFFVLETTQWSLSNSGATNPAIAVPDDTNESGAIAFTAAATNATATIIRVNNQYALSNSIVMGCAIRIGANLPTSTDDYSFVMSVWAGASVDPTRWAQQIGIRIVRSGANAFFQAICRNTTETTVTDTTVITTNTTYVLQFRKVGSSVVFYVNGVLIATISSNVPTSGMANIIYRIQKISGTASRTVQQYQHYERLTRTSLLSYANL